MARRVVAFFDFDRTLIGANSGTLWIQAERRAGRLSRLEMAVAAAYFLRYYLSIIDMDEAMTKALGTVIGEREEVIEERTRAWYRAEVRQHLLRAALETVEDHRRQGHLLVLLTTSSPYLSRAVVEDLRLDDYGATAYEIDDEGRFTGALVKPTCYGAGKVTHARIIAERHGSSVEDAYFYTDSYSDRALLEIVRHPRAVNADPRLRRLARRRSWPLLDWRERGGRAVGGLA